ncbi:MAG: hypothetical protein QM740_20025 [Acidovorax sp.]
MSTHGSFKRVWAMPLLLAALTLFGLLAALLGTGVWHGLAWRLRYSLWPPQGLDG